MTTTGRGYGIHHQRARRRVARLVASGAAFCTRCGELLDPLDPWDLDHTEDRRGYLGPAHQSCNRSAGARKRNGAGARRVSREW